MNGFINGKRYHLRSIADYAHNFGFSGNVAINFGKPAHFLNFASDSNGFHLQNQSVAGQNRTAKTRLVDAAKKWKFVAAVFKFPERQNRADLSERFDLQNAGHYGCAGKMSAKKMFVKCYLFDADDFLARDEFYNFINQQKRIAVRQYFLNGERIKNNHTLKI